MSIVMDVFILMFKGVNRRDCRPQVSLGPSRWDQCILSRLALIKPFGNQGVSGQSSFPPSLPFASSAHGQCLSLTLKALFTWSNYISVLISAPAGLGGGMKALERVFLSAHRSAERLHIIFACVECTCRYCSQPTNNSICCGALQCSIVF